MCTRTYTHSRICGEVENANFSLQSIFKGKHTQNINLTCAESCLQTMVLGKIFMKIGPTVWKIQALKCFKITVMGAAILIWQSRDRFLKKALHRSVSVCEAKCWCISINSNANTCNTRAEQKVHRMS